MSRYGTIDYPTVTKRAFLLGASLFILGIVGEVIAQTFFAPLPAWEQTLLVTIVGGGILLALVAPIVFGVILPLTEYRQYCEGEQPCPGLNRIQHRSMWPRATTSKPALST